MQDQAIHLLLQEFRAFRDVEFREFHDEVSTWKQELGERITALETMIRPAIRDNGQPSRLTVVENRVSALEKLAWRAVGGGAVLWTIFTVVLHFVPWGKH